MAVRCNVSKERLLFLGYRLPKRKKCWRVPLGQLMMDLLWIYPFSRMQIVTTKIITFLGSLLTFICRPITGWGVRSKVSIYIVRNPNLNLRYVRICILWWEVDPGFIQEFLKTPEVLGFRRRKHQVWLFQRWVIFWLLDTGGLLI